MIGMAEIRRAILTDAERKAKAKIRSGDGAGRQAMMAALKAQIALEEEAEGGDTQATTTTKSPGISPFISPRDAEGAVQRIGSGSPRTSTAILNALNDDGEGETAVGSGDKPLQEGEEDEDEDDKGCTFYHTPCLVYVRLLSFMYATNTLFVYVCLHTVFMHLFAHCFCSSNQQQTPTPKTSNGPPK